MRNPVKCIHSDPVCGKCEAYLINSRVNDDIEIKRYISANIWINDETGEIEMKTKAKAAHTPGPWIVNGDFVEHREKLGSVETAATIARCDYIGPIGMRKANADLIAAAPELLSICKELVVKDFQDIGNDGFRLWEELEAAIRKATGGNEAIAKARGNN